MSLTVLHAEPLDGRVRYRLEAPNGDVALPLQRQFVLPLDADTFATLRAASARLLGTLERPQFPADARQRGALLYRSLVPAELREQLRNVRDPLLVSTSLTGVPWELFFDGVEHWGLRYAIGRRLLLDRAVPVVPARRRPVRPRALIVGADPHRDLPFVHVEVERVAETLGACADIVLVSGPLATFDAVAGHLSDGVDLVHVCGHVVAGADGMGLLLSDERVLTAPVLERLLAGNPVVVVNGCASARGRAAAVDDGWEERFLSVAHGFLFGGAMAVIGTVCAVSDERAATLATGFYRALLAGDTVGEALRVARVDLRAAQPGSPAWLSFVLFGDPSQRFAPVEPPIPAAVQPARAGRPVLVGLGAALVAVLAGGLVYQVHREPTVIPAPARDAARVVGVMGVRARRDEVPVWMREITRDALNTMLSKVGSLRVYSRQKIDFVREKRQLTEIEAAEQLGMTDMLSVTLDVAQGDVILELEVVDPRSGLLEATERVRGPAEQLIGLQNQLALASLQDLGAAPTAAERQALLAGRTTDALDGYRRLADTMRGAPEPPPSRVPSDPGSWLEWPTAAYAAESSAEERAVAATLEAFRAALQAKDVPALVGLQTEMPDAQRRAYTTYFEGARDLVVHFSTPEVLVEGSDALATFTRRDTFVDVGTGRPVQLEVQISCVLVKRDDRWKVARLQSPS